jgi:hypothetical protein
LSLGLGLDLGLESGVRGEWCREGELFWWLGSCSGDVFVDAGEASEGGAAGGGARLGALDGGDGASVGHVRRDGLGGIAGDGAEVDSGDGDVHVRERGTETVD